VDEFKSPENDAYSHMEGHLDDQARVAATLGIVSMGLAMTGFCS